MKWTFQQEQTPRKKREIAHENEKYLLFRSDWAGRESRCQISPVFPSVWPQLFCISCQELSSSSSSFSSSCWGSPTATSLVGKKVLDLGSLKHMSLKKGYVFFYFPATTCYAFNNCSIYFVLDEVCAQHPSVTNNIIEYCIWQNYYSHWGEEISKIAINVFYSIAISFQ